MKLNPKTLTRILGELWQNSIFNPEAFELLQQYITNYTSDSNLRFTLSTLRNRNLITQSQQLKLANTTVAVFGLSVGSHTAVTWAMESRAKNIKISDPDTIDPTNLNRLKVGWDEIGRLKTESTKQQLLKINPDQNISTLTKTSQSSVQDLIESSPMTDIIVDAIDDFRAKVLLRQLAQKHRIPLVSAADVGDNIMIDIERWDKQPQPKPFLGKIDPSAINFETLSPIDQKKLIIKLIGFEENSHAMLASLTQIGESLATWPQLGATATIAGGIVTTVIKKLILGEKVNSGRYYFSLDNILVSDFNSAQKIAARNRLIQRIKNTLK